MRVATLLFTYHRAEHTKAVLDGLSKNYVLPEKLLVFQDGEKEGENQEPWQEVNCAINGIDFCPTEVFISKTNKGLAQSVLDGVNLAFREYDAIIVLEDDCLPNKNFMGYMLQCLKKYEKELKVFSVSGFAYPVSIDSDKYDAYFHGRFISWGWGTWKNRWDKFSRSADILTRIMANPQLSSWMATWSKESPRMLLDNLQGKNDSWAVYWALNIFEQKGLCVSPYQSKIFNIGFDGTGVHCGVNHEYDVDYQYNEDIKSKYIFPESPTINDTTRNAFIEKFGSYVVTQTDTSMEHIVIYGLGNYYFKHEKELTDHFYIEAYIDRAFQGYFAGRPILTHDMIYSYKDIKFIIMLENAEEGSRVKDMLHSSFNIPLRYILLGSELVDAIQ